jgi:hypothetical protein
MSSHFFAAPDFLELLRFWEASRGGHSLPAWHGDIDAVPRVLLPNLTVSDRRTKEPVYAYVGAEIRRRWGGDLAGQRIYADVLKGAHARYIRSLGDDTIARRVPIFSAAIYQPDATGMIMTGRLFAPFAEPDSATPCFLLTVQLFTGSDRALRDVGAAGFVHEIRRDMIAMVPELCTRLEAVRHRYQISAQTPRRSLIQDVDTVARELTGSALVALSCFEEPDPVDA